MKIIYDRSLVPGNMICAKERDQDENIEQASQGNEKEHSKSSFSNHFEQKMNYAL